jgi:thiamine-monophosphate kinase
VAVTGTVGDAAGGVRLLTAGGERAADAAALLQAQERPQPRVDAGLAAVAAGIRCGMDVSDGLVQDLGHIAASSGVSISIDAASVPLAPSLRRVFPEDALDLALTGGEDYQLLLCGPAGALKVLIAQGLDLTIVGEVREGEPGVVVKAEDGSERSYSAGGWDHFRGAAS